MPSPSQDIQSMEEVDTITKGVSEPESTLAPTTEPANAWAPKKEKRFCTEAKVNQMTNELILFQLHVRLGKSQDKRRVSGDRLMAFFQTHAPDTVDSFRQKSDTFFQVHFKDEEARDLFHGKKEKFDSITAEMESFPPPGSPFWKPTPSIINTKMRLLTIPAQYPLEKFEETLRAKVIGYIPESAQFETFVQNRKVKNGNLSFHVTKLRSGTPWLYIRIGEHDVQMENPLRPNLPGAPIPNSDIEAAKAKTRAASNDRSSSERLVLIRNTKTPGEGFEGRL